MRVFRETSKTMKRLALAVESLQTGMSYVLERLEQLAEPEHRLNRLSLAAADIAEDLAPVLEQSELALRSFTRTSDCVCELAADTRKLLNVLDTPTVGLLLNNLNETLAELKTTISLIRDLMQITVALTIMGLVVFLFFK